MDEGAFHFNYGSPKKGLGGGCASPTQPFFRTVNSNETRANDLRSENARNGHHIRKRLLFRACEPFLTVDRLSIDNR